MRLRGRYHVTAERYLRAGASICPRCAADGKRVSGARSPRISLAPTRAKVSRFDWRQGLFANAVAICAHDIRTALLKRRQRTWLAPMQHQRRDFSSYDLRTSVSQTLTQRGNARRCLDAQPSVSPYVAENADCAVRAAARVGDGGSRC